MSFLDCVFAHDCSSACYAANSIYIRCTKNYYITDFEHECFDQALSGLNAKEYDMIPADGGVQRFSIPGCSSVRYYPHQVWGIQFVVQRIINEDGLNSCLVADDMGMGKVCGNSSCVYICYIDSMHM